MTEYKTKQGETLDEICHRFYGSTYAGQVEAVLDANRALDLGKYVILPTAITIRLPALSVKPEETIRLFT